MMICRRARVVNQPASARLLAQARARARLARRLGEAEGEHAGEQQLADALDHLEVHAPRFVAVVQEADVGDLVRTSFRYFVAIRVDQNEVERRNPCMDANGSLPRTFGPNARLTDGVNHDERHRVIPHRIVPRVPIEVGELAVPALKPSVRAEVRDDALVPLVLGRRQELATLRLEQGRRDARVDHVGAEQEPAEVSGSKLPLRLVSRLVAIKSNRLPGFFAVPDLGDSGSPVLLPLLG